MSIQWPEESNYIKEQKRWNAPKREGGMNRDGFQEFPKMLYMAQPNPLSGKHEVYVVKDVISLDKTTILLDSQAFNASCEATVYSAEEEERYKREGWSNSRPGALEAHEKRLDNLATAAAQKNIDDRRMGEKAKAEAEKYEQATPHHVAEIPEQPRQRKPLSEAHKQKLIAGAAKAREAKKNQAN